MPRLGRTFQDQFRLVTAIDAILQEDASLALRQFHDAVAKFNAGPSQESGEAAEFYAKVSIRAFLGHVEGIGFALRRVVASCADEVGLAIPTRKLAELKERKYDADADSISDDEKRLSTEESIKLAATWFPKLFGADFRLDTDGEGWRGFKRIIRVRNNFTHPKRLEDLYPGAAFAAIQPTIVWFLAQIMNMFAECGSKIGIALPLQNDIQLEYPYKESKYPMNRVFSDDDISNIQAVGARTLKYVELMLTKSSRDVICSLDLIENRVSPTLSHSYQYAVRNAVRTLFSEVETRTAAAMFFVDAAEHRGELRLSDAERRALLEGEVEDKLVAALFIFSREFGNDFVPKQSGELWKQFRGTRFLRDRLTHPKDPHSLTVTAETAVTLFMAAQYFNETFAALRLDPVKYISKARGLGGAIPQQAAAQEESDD